MKKFLFVSTAFFLFLAGYSQKSIRDSVISTPMIQATYGFQLPSGDIEKRFGISSAIGIGFTYKTDKNFLLGADFNYIFGNDVKDTSMFENINTSQGFIIDQNGNLADVRLYERGFLTSLWAGKIFPVGKPNPNSGITVKLGLGMMQHKIRIEDIGNLSPQLQGDYKKGYDRLTSGLALSQFVGYTFFSNSKLLNFFAGFEITEGFTASRRSFDFDLMKHNTEKRTDILYGLKAGWILPLYKRAPRDYYYY